MTSNETNQRVALSGEASGSNVDPADAPQDDHHDTSSSSSGAERSGEASGSNAGTTDAPEGEASGPGVPQGDRRSTMSTSTPMIVDNIPPARRETTGDRLQQHRERMTAAVLESQASRRENEQLLSLQSELADARRQNTQLQQLLEEDSERHPSNKQAKANRAALTTVRNELAELRSLERAKDINDQSIVEYLAQTQSIADWKKNCEMEQVRQYTLIKWNHALINMGPVPDNSRVKIAKGLVGCFTHRG